MLYNSEPFWHANVRCYSEPFWHANVHYYTEPFLHAKYKLFVESVAIPDLASRRPYAVASERSEDATYRAFGMLSPVLPRSQQITYLVLLSLPNYKPFQTSSDESTARGDHNSAYSLLAKPAASSQHTAVLSGRVGFRTGYYSRLPRLS